VTQSRIAPALTEQAGNTSVVTFRDVVVWNGSARSRRSEQAAREEPLEIRLAGLSVAVTMRTPGHDVDLVTGFLVTEGIVPSAGDIASIAYCPDELHPGPSNIINVNLLDATSLDPKRWQRNLYVTSSCGVCGKASIDSVMLDAGEIRSHALVELDRLYDLELGLLSLQKTFRRTGGIHAAGLFDLSGSPLAVREDIGRHNAVDKVVGWAVREAVDQLPESILMVSGRVSFEVVQKALVARIPILAAVSAPSSLAVELARSSGMTLIAFLRGRRCNVYAGVERVHLSKTSEGKQDIRTRPSI